MCSEQVPQEDYLIFGELYLPVYTELNVASTGVNSGSVATLLLPTNNDVD